MMLRMCSKCVMDSTDPDLTFDDLGVCHYCREVEKKLDKFRFTKEQESKNLNNLLERINKRKRGKYDAILGLSGGVDSSYVALVAHQLGLNPLCVHFDNGWNSEIAVKNIKKIIEKTGFDLYTSVIDWPEFKDLQRAFFKAGVIDIEMITDHAINATVFKIARKKNIKTVLSGTNFITEYGMPPSWTWGKMDKRQLLSIHKAFGERKLKSFPTMNTFFWLMALRFGVGGIYEEPLNAINYSKNRAMAELKVAFDWEYYGGKHYESVFTKFYQAFILPTKFGVDKRKVHFSCLIRSGEITKLEALEMLDRQEYSKTELRRDKAFVVKKLSFSEEEFNKILQQTPVSHYTYSTDRVYMNVVTKLAKFFLALKA